MIQYPMAVTEIMLRFWEKGKAAPKPTYPAEGSVFFRNSDLSTKVISVPTRVNWVNNNFRTADTAVVEISFSDLPIDPRTIERAAVVIYAWAETPARWKDYQQPNSDTDIPLLRKNARFVGIADEIEIQASDKGDSLVFICRDLTGLLLDADVPTKVHRSINFRQSLLGVISGLVASLIPESSLKVVADADVQNVQMGVRLQEHLLGVQVSEEDKGISIEYSAVKYWDLITDICLKSGVVPVVELDQVRLRKPSTLYAETAINAPAWIWGHNIAGMTIKQKYTSAERKPVEVRCFDIASGKQISARFPASPREAARVLGINPNEEGTHKIDYSLHIVHGVTADALPDIAKSLFFELGRHPLEVSFETEYMNSFTAEESMGVVESDLLNQRTGDPVAIYTKSEKRNEAHELLKPASITEISSMSRGELERLLIRRGIRSEVVSQMARALKSGAHHSIFRCQAIDHTISGTHGYAAKINATGWREVPKQ